MRRDGECGATMVELAVAAVLLMVLLVPAQRFLTSLTDQTAAVGRTMDARSEARHTFATLVREVRQAHAAAVSPIEEIAPSRLTFVMPDRSTPYRLKRVRYQLDGTTLTRAEAVSVDHAEDAQPWTFPQLPPASGALDDVVRVSFQGLDAAGNPTSDAAAVAHVRIEIEVDSQTARSPGPQRFATVAELRNQP